MDYVIWELCFYLFGVEGRLERDADGVTEVGNAEHYQGEPLSLGEILDRHPDGTTRCAGLPQNDPMSCVYIV